VGGVSEKRTEGRCRAELLFRQGGIAFPFARLGGFLDLIDWVMGDGGSGRAVGWVRWVGLPAGQLVARSRAHGLQSGVSCAAHVQVLFLAEGDSW
jgi:hypothetical protein